MATPTTDGRPGPGFDAPGFDDPGFDSGHALTVPKRREAWTYYVSPSALQCVRGNIVARLMKAWHIPGMNGNGRVDTLGKGFGTALVTTAGAVRVPHRIETTVHGASYYGDQSNYLRKVVSPRHGHYYVEAWNRPRLLGSMTVWDFDDDGWLKFRRDVTKLVIPGALDPAQVEIATRSLFESIREVGMRDDNRAKAHLAKLLVHVPLEHAPDDIRALCESHGMTAEKTTTRRGAAKS